MKIVNFLSTEELELLIPLSFDSPYKNKCSSCNNHEVSETVKYEREIIVKSSFDKNNKETRYYKICFKPRYYKSFKDNPEIINTDTGLYGWKKTLKEAFLEIIEILENKNISITKDGK